MVPAPPPVEAAAINAGVSTLNTVAEKTGLSGYIGNTAHYARKNKKFFQDAVRTVQTIVSKASHLLDSCPKDGGFDEIVFDWLLRVKQLVSDFKSSRIAKKIPTKWTGVGLNIELFSKNKKDNIMCKPADYSSVSDRGESVHRARFTKIRAAHIGEKSKELLDRAELLKTEYDHDFKMSYEDRKLYKKRPCPELPAQTDMNTLVGRASELLNNCPKDKGFNERSFDWFLRVMDLIEKFENSGIVTAISASWSSAREHIRQFKENDRYKPAAYAAAPSEPNSQPLVRRNGATDYEIEQKTKNMASEAANLVKECDEKLMKDYRDNKLYEEKPSVQLPAQTRMTTLVRTASELLNDCPVDSRFHAIWLDWLHHVMQLINDFESSGIATGIPSGWSRVREIITQFTDNTMYYKTERYAEVDSAQICEPLFRNPDATDQEIKTELERLSRQVEELIKAYDEKYENMKKENKLFTKRPRCQLPGENNGVNFMKFKCRSETWNKVLSSIDSSEPHITLIYGPGGIGKTTILSEIARKAENDDMFTVVYAKDSRKPAGTSSDDEQAVSAIQDTIACQLRMSLQAEGQTERSSELKNNINGHKRVLVILDDVWKDNNILASIGIHPSIKVKVLVGSRRRDLPLGQANKIQMDVLSEEDSSLLLHQEAQPVNNGDEVVRQVQAECCGLPLALAVIGKALSGKCLVEWKHAADYLKNSDPNGLEDVEAKLYKIIKYSYDNLPTEINRKVFLSCCLFPESEEVHEVDLQRHLHGEEDVNDREVAGSVYTLEHYGLLQMRNRPGGNIKMHDVVRDVAVYIARKKEYAFIICDDAWPKTGSNKKIMQNCKRLSLSNINEVDDKPNCPELQTLLIRRKTVLPDPFFKKLGNSLVVLDLSGSEMSTLPTSMGNLKSVRTLLLNGCKQLSDVEVIVKLTGLQVLSLRKSAVKSLPKKMKNLLNLIVLDWEYSLPSKDNDPDVTEEQIKGICKLKELSLKSKPITAGAFLEITKLKHLKAVKLYVTNSALLSAGILAGENSCTWNKFTIYNHFDSLMPSETKDFNISIKNLNQITHGVQVLLRKAQEVVIENCFQNATRYEQSTNGGTESGLVLTEATGEGTLNKTSILRVNNCANISYLTSKDGVALTELEDMELKGLQIFIGIFKPDEHAATRIFLGKVRRIAVDSCHEVECVMPKDVVLQNVHDKLEVISVRNCKKVECIFRPEVDCSDSFSKLTSIVLDNLEKLNCIWQGTQPDDIFKCLKELSVKKCNMVTSLFTTKVAKNLENLQKLTVEDNSGLKEIVSTDDAHAALSKQAFPRLTHLSLQWLPELIHFNSGDINFDWPALVKLNLGACPKLTGLPIGPGSARCMDIIDLNSRNDRTWYSQLNNEEVLRRFEIWANDEKLVL